MIMYDVEKVNIETEESAHYGLCTLEDLKLITRGYHYDSELKFYSKKNSNTMYIVTEVNV